MDINSAELLKLLRAQKKKEKINMRRYEKSMLAAICLLIVVAVLYAFVGYAGDFCDNVHNYGECRIDY